MILLAFLSPLAIYLLIIGAINRRRRPLLVSGPWDFAGLLFAASLLQLSVSQAQRFTLVTFCLIDTFAVILSGSRMGLLGAALGVMLIVTGLALREIRTAEARVQSRHDNSDRSRRAARSARASIGGRPGR